MRVSSSLHQVSSLQVVGEESVEGEDELGTLLRSRYRSNPPFAFRRHIRAPWQHGSCFLILHEEIAELKARPVLISLHLMSLQLEGAGTVPREDEGELGELEEFEEG